MTNFKVGDKVKQTLFSSPSTLFDVVGEIVSVHEAAHFAYKVRFAGCGNYFFNGSELTLVEPAPKPVKPKPQQKLYAVWVVVADEVLIDVLVLAKNAREAKTKGRFRIEASAGFDTTHKRLYAVLIKFNEDGTYFLG